MRKEGRNDSLKLGFEEYLKKEKRKRREKTSGQLPLASDIMHLNVISLRMWPKLPRQPNS